VSLCVFRAPLSSDIGKGKKKRSKDHKRLEEAFAKTLSFTCGLVTNSPPEQPD
jgi:hypothetical protein